MNASHLIILTIHLSGEKEFENISLRKSWDLDKSPFWTEYLEAKPSDKRVFYPILPYPRVIFQNLPLDKGTHFDFESGNFIENHFRENRFRREIQVDARVKSVKIRKYTDEYKEAIYATAKDANLFLAEGWVEV